ncbi:hypothetical protein [Kineococcus rhizosphaerae]|uniref:Uncharacterized protein n=1 Tax=Kineococcus rhizosphaerae TaxID=559628 RepID=A0A2T0R4E8_9ACTN|nr:hypothetical protein [Kineococcus rhizosphaerae]PRY15247.1 hypothetical protein CLV37_105174 [Kineococcus rhizosphaerae]
MSEGDDSWRFDVDGEVLEQDRIRFSDEEFRFPVGDREVLVEVDLAYGGFATRSSLEFDGSHVEPLRR